PFKKAIRFKGQGQFHPVKYVYGMAKAFESAGGNILQNCFVQDVKEGRILEVQTTRGVFKTKKLIYATHIPPGVNMLHMRCAPYRSYVMAAELKNNAYPEFPAYDMKDPYHYYRTQEMGGKKYLIAGGEDHKTGHEKDTDLPFDRLGSYLKRYFKIKNIAFQWSSQYFDPADGLAYIGHLPGSSDNIFVATGFGGNGMTYSHIAAKVLSTLIISGNHEYENIFNPGRIKPVAGFSNFIKENSDVVSSFVGDRIDMYKSSSLAGLRNGTGRVIKKPGHSPLGVSKDEIGKIHAIDPVCTHLKCIVQWNKTEKSWDCPCHGARYSMDGEVLNAPGTVALASAPTEKKELDDKSAGEKVLADK
ncbi:MAG TPA: FAD-dependent oxidoreductase, partial [Puia sp.]